MLGTTMGNTECICRLKRCSHRPAVSWQLLAPLAAPAAAAPAPAAAAHHPGLAETQKLAPVPHLLLPSCHRCRRRRCRRRCYVAPGALLPPLLPPAQHHHPAATKAAEKPLRLLPLEAPRRHSQRPPARQQHRLAQTCVAPAGLLLLLAALLLWAWVRLRGLARRRREVWAAGAGTACGGAGVTGGPCPGPPRRVGTE